MRRILAWLFLPSLLVATTACSVSLAEDSDGEDGELEFSATQGGVFGCLLGCPIEGDLMVGGTLDVVVTGGDPNAVYSARALPNGGAAVSLTEGFACEKSGAKGQATKRDVMRRDECAPDEALVTTRSVAVTPTVRGKLKLQILDEEGAVVDAVDLTATDATQVVVVDPAAEETTPLAEPLVLGVNETIPIAFTFRDADDHELLVHRLAAGTTVAPRDGKVELAFPVFGALTVFFTGQTPIDMTGKAVGSTAIIFTLPGQQLGVPVEVK